MRAEKPDLEEIEAYDDVLSRPDFAQLAACTRPGQPEPAAYFDLGDNSSLCIPLDVPRYVPGSYRSWPHAGCQQLPWQLPQHLVEMPV